VPFVSLYYVSKGQANTAIFGFLTLLILPSDFLEITIPYKTNDSYTLEPRSLQTLICSMSKFFGLLGRA